MIRNSKIQQQNLLYVYSTYVLNVLLLIVNYYMAVAELEVHSLPDKVLLIAMAKVQVAS